MRKLILVTFTSAFLFSGTGWAMQDSGDEQVYQLIDNNCPQDAVEKIYRSTSHALKKMDDMQVKTAKTVIPVACQMQFARWKLKTTLHLVNAGLTSGISEGTAAHLVQVLLKNKVISRNRFISFGKKWQLFHVAGIPSEEIEALFKRALKSHFNEDSLEALGFCYLFFRKQGLNAQLALNEALRTIEFENKLRLNDENVSRIMVKLCGDTESKFCEEVSTKEFPWQKSRALLSDNSTIHSESVPVRAVSRLSHGKGQNSKK